MKRALLILCALGVVIATGYISYDRYIRSPALVYAKTLGVPAPYTSRSDLPNLALQVIFDQVRSRVITRQNDGRILSWDLKKGRSHVLAQTDSVFAYCRENQRLLVSDGTKVMLHDLTPGTRRHITSGDYDYAAWRADCARFALADDDTKAVEHWRADNPARIVTVPTKIPVRNGITMSANGHYMAAAQGTYSDTDGHRTRLDIFLVSETGNLTHSAGISDSSTVLGMWKMVFTPDAKALLVGSQISAQAGLRSLSPGTGNVFWGHDGFESYWVRALAASPDGTLLVTGDEKGLLRGWDIRTGRKLFQRHAGLVIQSLSFSPDGKQLAVALKDGTIGIVDLRQVLE